MEYKEQKTLLIKFMEWQMWKKPLIANFTHNTVANNFLDYLEKELTITEEEVLDLGFEWIDDEENDDDETSYHMLFEQQVFGTGNYMYGKFMKDGYFKIVGIPYNIYNIEQIRKIISALGLTQKFI